MRVYRFLTIMAAAVALVGQVNAARPAKPVYRDPVYDGAADPSIVYDHARKRWTMFYTNRRATMKLPDPDDVAWVHGTRLGVATSRDGVKWDYRGTATLPAACASITSWAPELFYENGTYHMFLTVVPGIFHRWGAPGASAHIVHLTSRDLTKWTCGERLNLGARTVIDASVLRIGDKYRLWFKDEIFGSRIVAADSPDLRSWTRLGDKPISETRGEGPKAFWFKGYYWVVADAWKGLMVLRSDDAEHWTQQSDFLLAEPGKSPTDRGIGQHPDVLVSGDRAFIYYFVHQGAEPEAKNDPYWKQRTVIQVAELKYKDDKLVVDRDADLSFRLDPPVSRRR
jgi:sucrose-6-phosphate hydrolase SacC (GH32 family)